MKFRSDKDPTLEKTGSEAGRLEKQDPDPTLEK